MLYNCLRAAWTRICVVAYVPTTCCLHVKFTYNVWHTVMLSPSCTCHRYVPDVICQFCQSNSVIRRQLRILPPSGAVSSPPFPLILNRDPLFKARNDLYAGEIKLVREEISVMAPLTLLVPKSDATAEVYNMQEGDSVEIGPFQVYPPVGMHAVSHVCSASHVGHSQLEQPPAIRPVGDGTPWDFAPSWKLSHEVNRLPHLCAKHVGDWVETDVETAWTQLPLWSFLDLDLGVLPSAALAQHTGELLGWSILSCIM